MEYLYINDQYCANPEELKTLLTDPGNQKSKQFRNEVLAFFRDGILGKWCEQHGIAMQYSDKNDTDDKAFKEIVKTITGNEVSGNLSSKFNEIGEFLRAEIEGQSYTITDGKIDVVLDKETTSSPIKFVFKCLKPENNDYTFTFGTETQKKNWKVNKGEEVVYEFSAKNIGNYRLNEGDNNQICEIDLNNHPFSYYAELISDKVFEFKDKSEIDIDIKFKLKTIVGPDYTIELGDEKQILKIDSNDCKNLHFSPKNFGTYDLKVNGKRVDTIEIYENLSLDVYGVKLDMLPINGGSLDGINVESFYLAKYQVTQKLWEAIMYQNPNPNPSKMKGATYPVTNVRYKEIILFIRGLNEYFKGRFHFRLPSLLEWKFAAKGGVKSKGYSYSGSNNINDVAWFNKNTSFVLDVGKKAPNELGLFDMSGNVWEVCENYETEKLYISGGGYTNDADDCLISKSILWGRNNDGGNNIGFRLALDKIK